MLFVFSSKDIDGADNTINTNVLTTVDIIVVDITI